MMRVLRKPKLHTRIQLGDAAHLIAANNFRIDPTPPGEIWLLFDTAPSLATSRRQEAMHRDARAWAESPHALNRIELPGFAEELADATDARAGDAAWYLRVEMGRYGAHSYRVHPSFEAAGVVLEIERLINE